MGMGVRREQTGSNLDRHHEKVTVRGTAMMDRLVNADVEALSALGKGRLRKELPRWTRLIPRKRLWQTFCPDFDRSPLPRTDGNGPTAPLAGACGAVLGPARDDGQAGSRPDPTALGDHDQNGTNPRSFRR